MAANTGPYSGMFGTDPTVNPNYLQLPAGAEPVQMPYSPEGWEESRLLPPGEGKTEEGTAKAKAKPAQLGFTPEQMALLSKMTSVPSPEPLRGAPGAPLAPRSQVGQMQQLTLPQSGGNQSTAPRASLGQIIYGGRKF